MKKMNFKEWLDFGIKNDYYPQLVKEAVKEIKKIIVTSLNKAIK
jgi:hypothetical protein